MGYYESALAALPFTSYKLNSAETGYTDIAGRGGTFSGSVLFSPSILAGVPKSLSVTGGTTNDITTSVFKKGGETASFSLVAWFAPLTFQVGQLSILSHTGAYDGLIFDGDFIRFRIKSSLNNYLETSWPVPDLPEAYMVVGVYTNSKIQLFINGEVVSEAEVTDEFRVWAQESSSNLYVGQSATAYRATVDGLTTYAFALTSIQIKEMFAQGRDVISTVDAVGAYGGSYWTGVERDIILQRIWIGDEWTNGLASNVSATDGTLKPQNDYSTGLSMPGTWRGSLELHATELTAAGAVDLDWDGDGSFIVETSVNNGGSWATAVNGRNVVNTTPLNTTNLVMDIRITFAGGIANDISVVRRLRATVFADTLIQGNDTSRTLTLTANVSTPLEFNEPIERNISSGIDFYNGSLTVSADASGAPRNAAAMEFWIRPRSAAVSGAGGYVFDSRGGGGTAYMWINSTSNLIAYAGLSVAYINGVSTASGVMIPRYNEWLHVLAVFTTPFNTPIIVGPGQFDGQISQISIYPTALTASQALALYQSYGRVPVGRVDDSGLITIAEPAVPINMYAYNWESTNA
jgi:hypothetical protein